ncbi:MAG TPA: hypothetical protein VGO31_03420 [Microbacteriaceae bacterium]|nr:hypothetical protein [Microbacteriaceae bacterium]
MEFVPSVRNATEFSDLSTRVSTYLGDAGVPMYLSGPRFEIDERLVPFFDPSLVRDPGWLSERPTGRRQLVVHRLTPSTIRAMVSSREPSRVVDHRLHSYSEMEYFALRDETSWPTYEPAEVALERLEAVRGASAFILATGPSALMVDLSRVSADVRITCNSAVRNLDLIREFRPHIIACTDPVFHFGPSRYAATFREDLVRAAEEVDALVLCGEDFVGPLLGLRPELRGRLVVLPHQRGGPWRWPTRRNPTVRQAGNVLTTLMLPVGLMLADDVAIAGADGREPTDNYFWRHNQNLQYSDDMMRSVFDAHPAFFRDRDYVDYYEGFCDDVESLASLGESRGKRVRAAAPSWIPALRSRGALAPQATGVIHRTASVSRPTVPIGGSDAS